MRTDVVLCSVQYVYFKGYKVNQSYKRKPYYNHNPRIPGTTFDPDFDGFLRKYRINITEMLISDLSSCPSPRLRAPPRRHRHPGGHPLID